MGKLKQSVIDTPQEGQSPINDVPEEAHLVAQLTNDADRLNQLVVGGLRLTPGELADLASMVSTIAASMSLAAAYPVAGTGPETEGMPF